MGSVLLIDDEPTVLETFLDTLARTRGYAIRVVRSAADGLRAAIAAPPDVVLLDLNLPDATGLAILGDLKRAAPKAAVVFVTASDAAGPVIEAAREGAFDYLFKPVPFDHLDRTVAAALDAARAAGAADPAPPAAEIDEGDGLVGTSPAMRDVYQAVGRAAPQDVTVLVTGESGTGKELVARAVWRHSRRADEPFLAINCAAIPEPLLESELFGHEKGAFTGADRRRVGKFEQCHGGTIFLDEIGDMPLSLQAKLLRVLQDGRFERVGGGTVEADVRVIAATHQNLEQMAEDGRFRRDLYFRLSVVPIRLPPLRERNGDVPQLVEHYLRRYNRDLGTQVREVSIEAMKLLRAYPWPGNVRELQSALKQTLLRAGGGLLLPRHLPAPIRGETASGTASADPMTGLREFVRDRLAAGTTDLWDEVREMVDGIVLPAVLAHTGGNQQQAAKLLGVARQTLRTRLRELGLAPAAAANAE